MDHVLTHAKLTEGEAPRLSPLKAFVAWVANLIAAITGMKRRKVFPANWKDHWEGQRQLEWCQAQIMAFCATQVLAGKSLNEDAGFELVMEVPDDYGRPCPSTPEEMNRRFILQQRFKLDPQKYILRHIQRIAKRAGIALTIDASGCPFRLAALDTSPGFAGGGHRLASLTESSTGVAGGGGRRVLHAHDGGGSHDSRMTAQARAPPLRLPTADCQLPRATALRECARAP